MALVSNYLKLTQKYKDEYGDKTLVLMQVGAFYEVYGVRDPKSSEITGSSILAFSKMCDLSISDKKMCVGKKNVMMAGFRDYMLDKYLKKLQKNAYTAVVYSQDEKAAGTTRSLDGIYSPGTYFSSEEEKITNNISCIWIDKHRSNLIIGCSNVDIYTGKSNIFEYVVEYMRSPTPYDELEKFISVVNPSEVICISAIDEIDDIISYASIKAPSIHKVYLEGTNKILIDRANNCYKQTYQQEILRQFFDEEIFGHGDFTENSIATQSYCFLLDFIYQHNPNLIHKISRPVFENCSDRLILANHSLKQLNILPDGNSSGKLSSVSQFLNNCMTPMGSRRFHFQLMNPTMDEQYLAREYDMIDHIKETEDVRSKLNMMRDIEKLNRKLVLKKITPSDFADLHSNLEHSLSLYKQLIKDKKLKDYLGDCGDIVAICKQLMKAIKNTLVLSDCKDIRSLDFDSNFIVRGKSNKHDTIVMHWMDSHDQLESLRKYFHDQLSRYEKSKKKYDYVKIHETEKSGLSLVATKRRITILQKEMQNLPKSIKIPYHSTFLNKKEEFVLEADKISYLASTGSNYIIGGQQINALCNSIFRSKNEMVSSLKHEYGNFINEMVGLSEEINSVVQFISLIDLLYCKCYTAKKFNYQRPSLSKKIGPSFINVEGLRHPLIEQLLQNELYVENDVSLNEDTLGILLYGTNAVGKSSFIKALGISLIMAQAGMFVPCRSFEFKPYSYLFTRILGNDNIFKGLSTFAVEMLELKTILNLANENSLVLGDELCSGTETDSAISIFLAGIDKLYTKKVKFIFATHFHEIVNYDEVVSKENLKLKHMSVLYNKEKDCLEYDRILKDGPGESMYGLEVCKSLHLPEDFLENAHSLRAKYNPIKQSILDMKTSQYNRRKVKGLCERCHNKKAIEVHHLHHQEEADKGGFIGGFHKNHLANLMSLCSDCHKALHKEANAHKKVKTTNGYHLKNVA